MRLDGLGTRLKLFVSERPVNVHHAYPGAIPDELELAPRMPRRKSSVPPFLSIDHHDQRSVCKLSDSYFFAMFAQYINQRSKLRMVRR